MTSEKTLIRPASRLDGASILRLIGELAAHHGDAAPCDLAQLKRDLFEQDPWASVLVADHRGATVGYAMLCRHYRAQALQRGMELHHLYVAPEARHRGTGRGLVTAAIAAARTAGCDFMSVGTHPDNQLAQAFYAGLGFTTATPYGPRFRLTL